MKNKNQVLRISENKYKGQVPKPVQNIISGNNPHALGRKLSPYQIKILKRELEEKRAGLK